MKQQKLALVDSIIKENVNKAKQLKGILALLPEDIFNKSTVYIHHGLDYVSLAIAYDWPTFRATRKLLPDSFTQSNTWEGESLKTFQYTNPNFPNVTVMITLMAYKEGSTCKMVENGTETITKYKMVCDDS